ncbi:hypothetical protein RIF29_05832 [Crotalaria pallida]|uniref:Uncharacterized protein n=1 Tax=Crotalaria pallida TaxID=3830 RepID=A0AAN9J3I5_CROPI
MVAPLSATDDDGGPIALANHIMLRSETLPASPILSRSHTSSSSLELSSPLPQTTVALPFFSIGDIQSPSTMHSTYDLGPIFEPMAQASWVMQHSAINPCQHLVAPPSATDNDGGLQALANQIMLKSGTLPAPSILSCSHASSSSLEPPSPLPLTTVAPPIFSIGDIQTPSSMHSTYDLGPIFEPMTQTSWVMQHSTINPCQHWIAPPSATDNDGGLQALANQIMLKSGTLPAPPILSCSHASSSSVEPPSPLPLTMVTPSVFSIGDIQSPSTMHSTYDLGPIFDPMAQTSWVMQHSAISPCQHLVAPPSATDNDGALQALPNQIMGKIGTLPAPPILSCSHASSSSLEPPSPLPQTTVAPPTLSIVDPQSPSAMPWSIPMLNTYDLYPSFELVDQSSRAMQQSVTNSCQNLVVAPFVTNNGVGL